MSAEDENIADALQQAIKAKEDKMGDLNKEFADTQAKINNLKRNSEAYREAVKKLENLGVERTKLQVEIHVKGFVNSIGTPVDIQETVFQDGKRTFEKRLNETVEEAIQREKDKLKTGNPGPLEQKYKKLFGANYENAIKLPRIIFESPYGVDVFEITPWEWAKKVITRGIITPGDSEFAKEFREMSKDRAVNYIYDSYSKNHSSIIQKGVLDQVEVAIKKVTGRSLDSYNEEYRKKLKEKGSKVTPQDLNAQFTPEQMKQILEDLKKEKGATWVDWIRGFIVFLAAMGPTVLTYFIISSALCQLGQSQSGCFATPPDTSTPSTTNILLQTLNQNGKKQYCVLDSNACKSKVGTDVYNSGTVQTDGNFTAKPPSKDNCCIECDTLCCDNLFSLFNNSDSKSCADKTCCKYSNDLFGLSNKDCAGLDPLSKEWKDKNCSSTRSGWTYKTKCVNGIDAITNLLNGAIKGAENTPGDIEGILRTVLTIIIAMAVIWVLERIVSAFILAKKK
jgi:hypothetical protein